LKNKRTTTVTTRVNVREALARAEKASLNDVEEKVLRMRHGASDVEQLELKGQQFAETRAKLAMIEQMLLDQMSAAPAERTSPAPVEDDRSTKAHIIRRLRDRS